MKPEELVINIKAEINSLIKQYAKGVFGKTEIGKRLDELGLSELQRNEVISLLRAAVEESTYNLIAGLEGSASLGGTQECYSILDENGNELTGELDTLYYKAVME